MFKLMAVVAGSVLLIVSVNARAFTGQQFIEDAKVHITQARAIAVRARSGKIVDEELEKERGGSGLRYSFDIRNGKETYEVGVDAQNGAVLENKLEGPNPD